MTIPESILQQFEAANPRAAALLSIAELSGVRLCTTLKGEVNLLDSRGAEPRYLHDQNGAFQEACDWRSTSIPDDIDLLVVFGIGMGWHWKALKPWLQRKEKRRVIILEDDIAVLSYFLQSEIAKELFDDRQSTLLFIDEEEFKYVSEVVTWNAYLKKWRVLASPFHARYRPDDVRELTRALLVQQIDVASVLNEFFTFGEGLLRNFGRNLFYWKRAKNAASLFGQFQGVPAIVTAAGPSLEEALPLLRDVGSKAVILSGGSSIGALLQSGVVPHFAATVDPNTPQYIRLRQAQPFCLPILYRSRSLFEGLMNQRGPLLYLRGGDGYPLVEWFEKTLGIEGEVLDGGNSVSNLLIDVAAALGCSPIIMVGYDLAYTKGERYARSISESLEKGEKLKFKGETRGEIVAGRDYEGKDVLTEVKWVVEANWIEKFHQEKCDIPLFNTTKNGLCLESVPYMQLADALSSYCSRSQDIDGKVHLAIQEAPSTNVSNKAISDAFIAISQSIVRCSEILKKLQELAEDPSFDEDSPLVIHQENEMEAEIAFEWIFQPFSMMHKKLWFLRKVIECRAISERAFNAKAARERYQLLVEACSAHQQFFFSEVGWAYLNGYFLPGSSSIPWPEDTVRCPPCLLTEG